MDLLAPIVFVCKRYGPGRLPYAHRRDVGAGYAMATVAAITTTAFLLVTQLVGISTIMSSWYHPYGGSLSEQLIGMISTVPAGFVAGVVVWRLPRFRRWHGIPAGVAAMLVMYPVSVLLDLAVVVPLRQLLVESAGLSLSAYVLQLYGATFYMWFMGYTALTTTFWLTLPLGAVGGYVHEYARIADTAR